MTTPLPILGTPGWVTDPIVKLDYLLSHFFLADYNQTYLYKDSIVSIQKIFQNNGNEATATLTQLVSELQTYLAQNFTQAIVEGRYREEDPNLVEGSGYGIELEISIYEDTGIRSVSRLLNMSGSKLQQIIKINNEGNA